MDVPQTDATSAAEADRGARGLPTRVLVWCGGHALRLAFIAYLIIAVTVLGLKYWVLPMVPEYRDQIADRISASLGTRVAIGDIRATWSGLHPRFDVTALSLHDQRNAPALTLGHVSAELSWRSLVLGELRLHSLVIDRPSLSVRRAADGTITVAGIELKASGGSNGGLGDWVLRQGEILVTDGVIEWTDELRGVPTLPLRSVDFRLLRGLLGNHRFALRAVPPAELAAAIDIRGDFKGDSLDDLTRWRGEVYVNLEYADLAGWQAWIEYPFEVMQGRGALRLWGSLAEGKMMEATADLGLTGVRARIAPDLPVLSLREVRGRLGAREPGQGKGFFGIALRRTTGYRIYGDRVALAPERGPAIEPMDFSLEWDQQGLARKPRGAFKATSLALEPLAQLAEALPLPTEIRASLARTAPRGNVADVSMNWTGPIDEPATYQASARFDAVAINGEGMLPGFGPLSGAIEATHRGGAVTLAGERVVLRYPFALPHTSQLDFNVVTAQIGWTIAEQDGAPLIEVKVPNLRVANAEMSADASLSWRSKPGTPGLIDLDIRVPKADPRAVYKYVPRLAERPALWLKNAFRAGTATEGRVRVKGELYHFPFEDGKHGTFQVLAKANAVTLQYGPDWPAFQSTDADFSINGLAMDIQASRATLYGARVTSARATVANLDADDPVLKVTGEAEGPTADFFRFLNESPLAGSAGAVVKPMRAQGAGRLALELALPLKRLDEGSVSGTFHFDANELRFDAAHPPLARLTGPLAFDDRGITAKGLSTQFLGGAAQLDLASKAGGGFTLGISGVTDPATVAKVYPFPFSEHLRGQARYAASVTSTPSTFDLTIESDLRGVSVGLPAPFAKAAAEPMPLKIERRITAAADRKGAPQADRLLVRAGELIAVEARLKERQDGRTVLERAGVALGKTSVALPERPTIVVQASLDAIDLDALLPVLRQPAGSEGEGAAEISSIQLRSAELGVVGRSLRDADVRVQMKRTGWSADVRARELAGTINWSPEGAGRIVAHFKNLSLPEARAVDERNEAPPRELPELDITAEAFNAYGKAFGRLELLARNDAEAWRIDKLELGAPEGTIRASGRWLPAGRGARTEVAVSMQANDAGAYLARMGQPKAVAGGKASLEGKLAWNGPPYAIHYPSLAGDLTLHAESGRFLKAEPGIGRLLGVLSLQALPRRISLDFRDVFSDGFSFDEINATASVAKGVLATKDFRMVGPAAAVGIAGEANLDKESQSLRVRVVPVVGDSVAAVAGLALLNPLVGLGSFIAQRLLKDPIGQLLAYEYAISGMWADPKVERIGSFGAPVEPEAATPQ